MNSGLTPGDIVRVKWDDHSFAFGCDGGIGAITTTTVGFFVSESDEGMVVALSHSSEGYAERQFIDRRMLLGWKKLA